MSTIRKLLHQSTGAFLKPNDSFGYVAIGMAVLILVAKISGIFKLQVLVSIFGIDSTQLDLFNAANKIPEFIFTVVAIGGINAALIPVLKQTSMHENERRLKEVLSGIVNFFFLILIVLCALVFIFAPQVVQLSLKLNPADSTTTLNTEEINLFVQMLRILIFSPIILCISSIFSSILQVKKRFLITQLSPLFYNFGVIFVALLMWPMAEKNVLMLCWGVILGSFLHFLVQVPSLFSAKVQYSPFIFNFRDLYVLKALKQAAPRTIGLTSDYIGNIFQTFIGIGLAKGSLTAFLLALSIRDIPVGMFGVATSQALYPMMSELAEKKDFEGLQKLFSKGLRAILFWTLPVTVLLLVLRTPYVRILFSLFSNKVTLSGVTLLSFSLLFLSFGIVFYSVLNLVNRVFYSLEDSKTPTVVSLCIIVFEVLLTYGCVNLLSNYNSLSVNPLALLRDSSYFLTNGDSPAAVGGLGLASSISIFANLSILIYLMRKKGIYFFYQSEYILAKIASALTMLVVGIISFKTFDTFFDLERTGGLIIFTANVTALMLVTYYLCEKFLKDEDIHYLDNPIRRIKAITKKILALTKTSKLSGITTSS